MISFFLGAGASNPFEYPATREFKEIIAKELDDKFEAQGNLPELEKLVIFKIVTKEWSLFLL